MAQPIITVYNAANTDPVVGWNIGEIKANDSSPTDNWIVWNNRGGGADVSDLKEASITALDGDGGNASAPVVQKWLEVLVNTTAEESGGVKLFSPVGGVNGRPLRAEGLLPGDGAVIKGTLNTGKVATAKNNHSLVSLKVSIPDNATEGNYSIRARIQGYYT